MRKTAASSDGGVDDAVILYTGRANLHSGEVETAQAFFQLAELAFDVLLLGLQGFRFSPFTVISVLA
jgi:hypothetical protein